MEKYVGFAVIVIVTFACKNISSGIHNSNWGPFLYLLNLMLQNVHFHLGCILIFGGEGYFDHVFIFLLLSTFFWRGGRDSFLPTMIIHIVIKKKNKEWKLRHSQDPRTLSSTILYHNMNPDSHQPQKCCSSVVASQAYLCYSRSNKIQGWARQRAVQTNLLHAVF